MKVHRNHEGTSKQSKGAVFMKKAMTVTVVFEGDSLNYGEGFGNNLELKKVTRGNGNIHTFISRQALRYDIVRLGNEWFDWNLDTVDKEEKVVQFKKNVTIEDSAEMDLFGYMRTQSSKGAMTRNAVARLSHGFSLETYGGETDFQTNAGLAKRIESGNEIVMADVHKSLYTYTITLDLGRVGVDKNDGVELSNEEKFKRVQELLTIIKFLNRHIRGRQENLNPLFVIGGVYPIANPFYQGRVAIRKNDSAFNVEVDLLKEVDDMTFGATKIGAQTKVGLAKGFFANEDELKTYYKEKLSTVDGFFDGVLNDVADYFGVVNETTSN